MRYFIRFFPLAKKTRGNCRYPCDDEKNNCSSLRKNARDERTRSRRRFVEDVSDRVARAKFLSRDRAVSRGTRLAKRVSDSRSCTELAANNRVSRVEIEARANRQNR